MYRMPFGKYKDEPIADLPRDYLSWLRRQSVTLLDALDDELGLPGRRWLEEENSRLHKQVGELEERYRLLAGEAARAGMASMRLEWLRSWLPKWFREAARRYHPDRGGSDEAMTCVNAIHKEVAKALE